MAAEYLNTLAAVIPPVAVAAALVRYYVGAELRAARVEWAVLGERVTALHQLMQTQIAELPCKQGHICHSTERTQEIADVRQAMDVMGKQISHLIRISEA